MVKHNLSRVQEQDALRPVEPLNSWYMFSTPTQSSREPVVQRPVQTHLEKPWYKWGGKTRKKIKRLSQK